MCDRASRVLITFLELIAHSPMDKSLDPAAVGAGVQYASNSIFDPNLTATGHQPLSHDQWSQFYQHYLVMGSKITIKVLNYEG
jgi:hypothetical protein